MLMDETHQLVEHFSPEATEPVPPGLDELNDGVPLTPEDLAEQTELLLAQVDALLAPPPQPKPRQERWMQRAKLVGAALATIAVAACSAGNPGHAQAHSERPSGPPSPTAAINRTVDLHEKVLSIFTGTTEPDGTFLKYVPTKDDTNKARTIIKDAPSGLLVPTGDLTQATDYYTAASAITDTPGYPDKGSYEQAKAEAGTISNPSIRAQAEHAVEATYADTAVQDASSNIDTSGGFDNASAEQTLRDDLAPVADPKIRSIAEELLAVDEAQSLVQGFSPSDPPMQTDIDTFKQNADKITDPSLRNAVMQGGEAAFAQAILNATTGEADGGISPDSAQKLIDKSISDPKVKEHALAALAGFSSDGMGGGYVPDNDDTLALLDLADPNTFYNNLTSKDEAKLYGLPLKGGATASDYFQTQGDKAALADGQALDNVLTKYNGHVTNESVKTIRPLENPDATIDLSHARGPQQIPNIGRFFTSPDEKGTQPAMLSQFGEIYAQGGKLHFEVQADAGLSPETVKRLETIVDNVRPILDAAFSSGDLISVHFVVSDEYNPYFIPDAHQIVVVLPKNNVVSMQELQGAIVHETGHALTNPIFSGENPPSAADTRQIVNACNVVRDTTFDTLQSNLKYLYPDLLTNLLAEASPTDKPMIETLIQTVESGSIANFFGPSGIDAAYLNNCLPSSVNDLMFYAANDTKHFPQKFKDDVDAMDKHLNGGLFKLPAFKKFYDQWVQSTETYAMYSTLNESNYVTNYTQDPTAVDEGHSQDNANELFASLFDDAVNYPTALGQAIGQLSTDTQNGDQQDAALIAVRTTLSIQAEHHPSLKPLCVERMHEIVKAAGVSLNNVRYFLPQE